MLTYFYKVEKDCVFYKRYFLVKNERDTLKKYEEKFFEENGLRKDLRCAFKGGKEFKLFISFNESECETYIKHIRKKSLNKYMKEIKLSSTLFKSYWNMIVQYVDLELIEQFESNPLPFCGKFYNDDLYFNCTEVDGELYVEAECWYDLPDCFVMMQPPEDDRIWDQLYAYTGTSTLAIRI